MGGTLHNEEESYYDQTKPNQTKPNEIKSVTIILFITLTTLFSLPASAYFETYTNELNTYNYDRPWYQSDHFFALEDRREREFPEDKFTCLLRSELFKSECEENASFWRSVGYGGTALFAVASLGFSPAVSLGIGIIGAAYTDDVYNDKINKCDSDAKIREWDCERRY